MQARTLIRGLGWLSLAIGVAELVGAKPMARNLGISESKRLRGFGLREIGSGVGLLSGHFPPALVALKRVVGDGMDLATLSTARPKDRRQWAVLGLAGAAVIGALALDAYAVQRLSHAETNA